MSNNSFNQGINSCINFIKGYIHCTANRFIEFSGGELLYNQNDSFSIRNYSTKELEVKPLIISKSDDSYYNFQKLLYYWKNKKDDFQKFCVEAVEWWRW